MPNGAVHALDMTVGRLNTANTFCSQGSGIFAIAILLKQKIVKAKIILYSFDKFEHPYRMSNNLQIES